MNPSDKEYSDLLGEHPESDGLRLARDLDRIYGDTLPPRYDSAIREALAEQAMTLPLCTPRHTLMAWLRQPFLTVMAALLLLMVSAGGLYAAYAAASLVDDALFSSPTGQQIVGSNQGETLNLAAGRCGFTMTVGKVYADRHRVIIGYSIRGPAGRTFLGGVPGTGVQPVLTDGDGHQLLPAEGGFALGAHGNQTGDFLAFDSDLGTPRDAPTRLQWLRVPTTSLSFNLTVPAIQLTEQYTGTAPVGQPCEQDTRGSRASGHWYRAVTVPGPFRFSFAVPVDRELRIGAPRQTVRTGGYSVKLVRVEIAPSDVRIYWRDTLSSHDPAPIAELAGPPLPENAPPISRLSTAQRHGRTYWRGSYLGSNHGLRVYDFDMPADAYHGEFTLLVDTALAARSNARTQTPNGISFHFTVP